MVVIIWGWMDGCPGFRQVRSGQSSKYMDFTIGKSVIEKDRIGSSISEEVMKKRAGLSKSNRPGLSKLTRHRAANLMPSSDRGSITHIYIYMYVYTKLARRAHTHARLCITDHSGLRPAEAQTTKSEYLILDIHDGNPEYAKFS